MWFPILVRWHLYIDSVPWFQHWSLMSCFEGVIIICNNPSRTENRTWDKIGCSKVASSPYHGTSFDKKIAVCDINHIGGSSTMMAYGGLPFSVTGCLYRILAIDIIPNKMINVLDTVSTFFHLTRMFLSTDIPFKQRIEIFTMDFLHIRFKNQTKGNKQECSGLSKWPSLWCLPWMNHLPPVWWSTYRFVFLKWQLVCKFGTIKRNFLWSFSL